jgi:hypothetical protein
LVRTPGLNCALKRSKLNEIFWGFWAQNTIKMKIEVRRIHRYTAEKRRKPTMPKLSRIKRTSLFISVLLSDLSTIQFRLAFKGKGYKSLLFSNTFDRKYNFLLRHQALKIQGQTYCD